MIVPHSEIQSRYVELFPPSGNVLSPLHDMFEVLVPSRRLRTRECVRNVPRDVVFHPMFCIPLKASLIQSSPNFAEDTIVGTSVSSK